MSILSRNNTGRSLPLILGQTRVNTDRGKIARDQEFVQFDCARYRLDEDDNLLLKVRPEDSA